MNRTFATLAVVALVVLSGCSLIGGGGSTATPAETPDSDGEPTQTPTETPTPDETPTPWATGTETPTATESTPVGDLEPVSAMSSLPPGVEDGAVTNVTALAAANQNLLTAGGHDLDMTIENSTREGAGRFRVANDTEASLVQLTEAEGAAGLTDLTTYFDSEEAGIRNRTSGEVAYGHGPTNTRRGARFISELAYVLPRAYISAPAWETAGSLTTDSGEERLVLQADALRPESERGANFGGVSGTNEEVQSVDARLEVTPDGLVRTLTVSLDLEQTDGETYTQTVSYTAEDLEAGSLDRPTWLSKAPQLQASTDADDRLLVVEHTGGPTIEAGTNLTVGGGFRSAGNVSADQPVSEGDTLYVYATGEGLERTPALSVNERPTLPENATAFSAPTQLSGSQGDYEFAAGVEIASESGDTAASLRSGLLGR
jgi:hypothetical protein